LQRATREITVAVVRATVQPNNAAHYVTWLILLILICIQIRMCRYK